MNKKNFFKMLAMSVVVVVSFSSCEHFALHLNHMHNCGGGGYRVVHHRPVVHHHHVPHHWHR